MNCAVITKAGHCPNEAVQHEACSEHLSWRVGNSGQLGFNLIVRNEEKVLAKCLQSIRAIADEIVVTDTGSDDDTIEVALKYADKVLFHQWKDDFSEARNFSIGFSRTKWIGWIDGDEWLLPTSVQPLLDLIHNDGGFYAIFCALLSELPDNRVSKHYLPKFFRGGTARFEAIVHNQLIHRSPVIQTDISFWHVGYNLPDEVMAKKRLRTITLLRKQLEENPKDAFAMMNLARTIMTEGEYEESERMAREGMALTSGKDPCKQMFLYNIAMCCANLDRLDDAIEACWQCLAINPENVDMLFILGWTHTRKGQYERALLYFQQYLEARKRQEKNGFNLLILDFWDATSLVYNYLSLCYKSLNLLNEALGMQRKAITQQPYNAVYWKSMAMLSELNHNRLGVQQSLFGAVDFGVADAEIFENLSLLQNRMA